MENIATMHLLGYIVETIDRRDGKAGSQLVISPCIEMPQGVNTMSETELIRQRLGNLGYDMAAKEMHFVGETEIRFDLLTEFARGVKHAPCCNLCEWHNRDVETDEWGDCESPEQFNCYGDAEPDVVKQCEDMAAEGGIRCPYFQKRTKGETEC